MLFHGLMLSYKLSQYYPDEKWNTIHLTASLFLSGYKIIGSLKCSQGGHNLTNQLLRKVFSDQNNYSLIEIKGKQLPHTFANYQNLKSIA